VVAHVKECKHISTSIAETSKISLYSVAQEHQYE